MISLGGNLVWQAVGESSGRLENKTNLKLSGAALVRRRLNAMNKSIDESAWLGDLLPGASVEVSWMPHDSKQLGLARDQSPLTAAGESKGTLNLRRLLDGVQDVRTLRPGEVRLVAWRDQGLKGIRVEPSASQARRGALVVAHLRMPQESPPRPDENLRSQALPEQE